MKLKNEKNTHEHELQWKTIIPYSEEDARPIWVDKLKHIHSRVPPPEKVKKLSLFLWNKQ